MKHLFTNLCLLLALSAAVPAKHHPKSAGITVAHTAATVYVCISKGSVAYHSSDNCAGLNRCSHEIKAMSVEAAAGLGKRACLKCY